eukprot:g67045.t1
MPKKEEQPRPLQSQPVVFANHGGGPLPLLGRDPELAKQLQALGKRLTTEAQPKAIVVISAHWESDPISITSAPSPKMYFDYGGFPAESYEYSYPAPGRPELAKQIQGLLQSAGIKSRLDEKRGYDHGVFVPLMLAFPKAELPVVCVSLHPTLDAQSHLQLGAALSPLRQQGVLLFGSGYTFHNFDAFFHPSEKYHKGSADFDAWLRTTVATAQASKDASFPAASSAASSPRWLALRDWAKAPSARLCHPREEHLLPLLVCAGAAGLDPAEALEGNKQKLKVSAFYFFSPKPKGEPQAAKTEL